MQIRTIDNGAPQYDPKTHYVVREWVEDEVTEPDAAWDGEGEQPMITYPVRVATYTVLPIPPSPQRVKAEAQRRIIALTGADDLQSCLIRQLNANMRANELNDVRVSGGSLSPEEDAEAAALRALADGIKAIMARSNEIEAMDPIPADFASDVYWE